MQDHLRGRRHARRLQYLRHMPVAERAKHIDRITSGAAADAGGPVRRCQQPGLNALGLCGCAVEATSMLCSMSGGY